MKTTKVFAEPIIMNGTNIKLKKRRFIYLLYFLALLFAVVFLFGCSSAYKIKKNNDAKLYPSSIIKPGEPIAIMPFESQDALSNLGGLVADEVTANLIENVPGMKIIPTTVTRSFLLTQNIPANGIPDFHSIHSLKEGLKCRYLLTGNFYSSIGEIQYTSSYSNRIATGSVTVRLIDCDSALVVWAKHIQDDYQTTTYYLPSDDVKTVYYTDGQLMQELISRLGGSISEYFYPTDDE